METNITNVPGWIVYAVGIAQIVFAVALALIAGALIIFFKKLTQILDRADQITVEVHKHLPTMLNNVDATLANVKDISGDARNTTHNVTGTVNRVSHVVGSVAGRLESPLIRTVGTVTGIVAGAKALRGGKKERREIVVQHEEPKKRGGLLGFFKK